MRLINLSSNKDNFQLPLSLFLITVALRIPFTSKLLYAWDSVQFALALDKFDVTTHQPHPPGSFLYVMLGRLLRLSINDANTVFVTISIVFSGLTVVAIYYLAKNMYDRKTGFIAAVISITSPNFWFHGEVALTYIVEAFFSALMAFLCWKIHMGKHKYIWLSVIALGIAGGIRLYTLIFLLPLWLFSVKDVPRRRTSLSIGLLVFISLLWVIPMILMSGGWYNYLDAYRELRLHTGLGTFVFKDGLFKIFSSPVLNFTLYGIGTGAIFLSLAAYSLIRQRKLDLLVGDKVLFYSFWILPSLFIYILMGTHPAIPGYALIYLPAFFILISSSMAYIRNEVTQYARRDLFVHMVLFLIITNSSFFLFSKSPVSYRTIINHDREISIILNEIRKFDASKTAIFVRPYIFYGYRHIMYYCPGYRVYDVDLSIAPTGEVRKLFWGVNRETFLTEEIVLPESMDFAAILFRGEKDAVSKIKNIKIERIRHTDLYIATGNILLIRSIYPELKTRLRTDNVKSFL